MIQIDKYCRKRQIDDIVDNEIGETNIFNKLIFVENVLGLANKSNDFANFLRVPRKFYFTCVYVLHTVYPTRSNWQMILSQTKIFHIFPGSLQRSSVIKILSPYCNRYTYEYIPHSDLWINRLYFEISDCTNKMRHET